MPAQAVGKPIIRNTFLYVVGGRRREERYKAKTDVEIHARNVIKIDFMLRNEEH